MMNNKQIFVDTNILIYSMAKSAPQHLKAQQTLQKYRQTTGTRLWISRQVIREYLVASSRPQYFTNPLPIKQLVNDVHAFQKIFEIANDDHYTTNELLKLLGMSTISGKRIHDVNIVATMLVNGISNLLTHNVQDFSTFSSIIHIIPL